MKKKLGLTFASFIFFTGCTTEIHQDCQRVESVITSSDCYDKGVGLTFTAEDLPTSKSLIWDIAIVRDTLPEALYKIQTFKSTSTSLTIPDSLINNSLKIDISNVGMECGSRFTFVFIRRINSDSLCTHWELKDKIVSAD